MALEYETDPSYEGLDLSYVRRNQPARVPNDALMQPVPIDLHVAFLCLVSLFLGSGWNLFRADPGRYCLESDQRQCLSETQLTSLHPSCSISEILLDI